MILKDILKNVQYELVKGSLELEINDIVYDSRKVTDKDLFIALVGSNNDGHKYIDDVIAKKVKCLIIEKDIDIKEDITVIKVENTRKTLAYLARNFFLKPDEKLITIGITGTKGKTTTSWMISDILNKKGLKCGIIGTMGVFYDNIHYPLDNTTPESYEVYKYMKEMVDNGIKYLVMEVSSQALKTNRVEGIYFNYGLFTNLTKDHIGDNEHKDMEEYIYCKSLLFRQCEQGIFNIDDDNYLKMIENCTCQINTFGMNNKADYVIKNIELIREEKILGIELTTDGKIEDKFTVNIPGNFSAYNAISAIALANMLNIDNDIIKESLSTIKIKGRVEQVFVSPKFTVLIDYAHNGISMESILTTIKKYNPKRIVSIFGCGGNRSRERRYDMGEISGKYADFSIITADNSRFEDVNDIIDDILIGMKKTNGKYITVPDRKEAIKYSFTHALEGDIILILGKGHEDYQEIKGVKYPFDERKIIKDILNEIKL